MEALNSVSIKDALDEMILKIKKNRIQILDTYPNKNCNSNNNINFLKPIKDPIRINKIVNKIPFDAKRNLENTTNFGYKSSITKWKKKQGVSSHLDWS